MAPQAAAASRLPDKSRLALLAALGDAPSIDPGDDPSGQSWHGRLVQESLPPPSVTWKTTRNPREDKHGRDDVPEWLTASEHRDDPEAFAYKIKMLANLLRQSKKTLAYTGAGLSVAAGIGMAAVGSSSSTLSNSLAAQPTLAHGIMAELNKHNLLHAWLQQNHDGLPQKAGYRQEDINEVHGSWYDPSNPVVKYNGTLRGDLCHDMQGLAESADLVLVVGTTLSGLNADQCVWKTAGRSLPRHERRSHSEPVGKLRKAAECLGSVIISPQRTPEDGEASLRLFAKADDVMEALAHELGMQGRLGPRESRSPRHFMASFSSERRVKVPYDRNGKRSDKVQTWWDLTPGAKLTVSPYNNISGAHQPAYDHISSALSLEAFPVGASVESHSLRTQLVNGLHGHVVGHRGDQVEVAFPAPRGKMTMRRRNLKLLQLPLASEATGSVGRALPFDKTTCCIGVRFAHPASQRNTEMKLGVWWIEAALRGGVEYLPVVNIDAVEEAI